MLDALGLLLVCCGLVNFGASAVHLLRLEERPHGVLGPVTLWRNSSASNQ